MKIKTAKSKKNEPSTVIRTNKASLPMLSAKRMYYYMDHKEDEEGNKEIFYVLVDNRKGKKEMTEYDSLKDMEKAVAALNK